MKIASPFGFLVVALALLFAGCSSSDAEDTTTTTSEAAVTTMTSVDDTGTDGDFALEESDGGPFTTPGEDPDAVSTEHGPEFFGSPSKNIGCNIVEGGVRCDISEKTYKDIPQSECAEASWSDKTFELDADGPGAGACISDSALPNDSTEVLAYGEYAQHGYYRCNSERDGMSCFDTRDGHGFSVARDAYRVF